MIVRPQLVQIGVKDGVTQVSDLQGGLVEIRFPMLSIRRASSCLVVMVVLGVCPSVLAQELSWAAKMLERQNVDFGVVARGADAVYRLPVKNIYRDPISITGVRTSCGCSAATKSHETLNSGEEGYIEIKMDTIKFLREKTSNVFVTFSIPGYGASEVQIPLKVYIRTDVVLTPGAANFGVVDLGQGAEKKIGIAYAGRPDWKILDVKSANPNVTAQTVETLRQNGTVNYDLIVKLAPGAPAGALRTQITLVTDDANSPNVPVLVEGSVESDISITPAIVNLGPLTAGQTKVVQVVVKGRKPFQISKVESTQDAETFKIKIPQSPAVVHVLQMSATPVNSPVEIDETFSVLIDGRSEPVTFRVTGRVTGTQALKAATE